MKALLVNKYFYNKGGAEGVFFQTASLLEKYGHQVCFFSMHHPRNIPSVYYKFFVSHVDYVNKGVVNSLYNAARLLYSFQTRRKIKLLIKQEKPDIAHLNNIYHQISPSLLHVLRNNNIPTLMTLHDYKLVCGSYLLMCQGAICEACSKGRYLNCFLKKCVKGSYAKSLLNTLEMYLHHRLMSIYNHVDIFISPSLFLKRKIEEMGFKGEIVYLPNFTIVEGVRPKYDSNERTIVYFGRLSSEKGLFTLIKSINGLDLTLKVIGDGPLREELETFTYKFGVTNIKFLGYQSGEVLKSEVLNSMFVVLPSECYENNPRTIIEGFALGKPAVGARIGGIPELIQDNVTGLTFEPGNAEDLAEKIRYLINRPDEIERMGRSARRLVEEKLNPEIHYQGLMNIYSRAIEISRKRK